MVWPIGALPKTLGCVIVAGLSPVIHRRPLTDSATRIYGVERPGVPSVVSIPKIKHRSYTAVDSSALSAQATEFEASATPVWIDCSNICGQARKAPCIISEMQSCKLVVSAIFRKPS